MDTSYTFIIIAILVVTLIVLYCLSSSGAMCSSQSPSLSEKYHYLGSLYMPADGGVASEYNIECLNNANGHCMLTDGTTGKCVLHGICRSSMLLDHSQSIIEKPYCTRPYFPEECASFCQCLNMKGVKPPNCINTCTAQFA